MISKKLAIDVLNEALATGADYAEIFYEDSSSNSISIENGKVETATSNALCGVGLRLLKENQCIYGYTNDLSKKGLFALANSLNKSLNGKRVLTVDNLDMIRCKNRNPVVNSYKNISIQEKIDLVKEGVSEIESLKDPRIVRYIGNFGHNTRFVAVFNSKGKWFKRETEFARLAYMVVTADENSFETGFEGPGCQLDISYFKNKVKARDVAIAVASAPLIPSG